jgi:hypothetical protein
MPEELKIQKDQADQMSGITIEVLDVSSLMPKPETDQEADVNDSPLPSVSVPYATGDSAPAPTPVHLEVKVPAKYEMGFQAGWRAAFDHLKPIVATYAPNAVVGTDIARLITDIAVAAEG